MENNQHSKGNVKVITFDFSFNCSNHLMVLRRTLAFPQGTIGRGKCMWHGPRFNLTIWLPVEDVGGRPPGAGIQVRNDGARSR